MLGGELFGGQGRAEIDIVLTHDPQRRGAHRRCGPPVARLPALLGDQTRRALRRETPSATATPGARYAPTAALPHVPADYHDRCPARPRDAATPHRSCSALPSMPPPAARQKAGETDIFKLDSTDICTLRLHVVCSSCRWRASSGWGTPLLAYYAAPLKPSGAGKRCPWSAKLTMPA